MVDPRGELRSPYYQSRADSTTQRTGGSQMESRMSRLRRDRQSQKPEVELQATTLGNSNGASQTL